MREDQAIDGDTAQVGPQIAEKLSLPQVTYVKSIEFSEGCAYVHRALEDGYEKLKVKLPCVLHGHKRAEQPQIHVSAGDIKGMQKEIKVWNAEDIGVDLKTVGLKASPTNVFKSFTPKPKGEGQSVEGRQPEGEGEKPNLNAERKTHHLRREDTWETLKNTRTYGYLQNRGTGNL